MICQEICWADSPLQVYHAWVRFNHQMALLSYSCDKTVGPWVVEVARDDDWVLVFKRWENETYRKQYPYVNNLVILKNKAKCLGLRETASAVHERVESECAVVLRICLYPQQQQQQLLARYPEDCRLILPLFQHIHPGLSNKKTHRKGTSVA